MEGNKFNFKECACLTRNGRCTANAYAEKAGRPLVGMRECPFVCGPDSFNCFDYYPITKPNKI